MEVKFYKHGIENDYISEKELTEVFQTQYNDIFHNFLKSDKNRMMMLLQEQVYLHLKLINKVADFSLIQRIFSKFLDKYSIDKEKVYDIYQIINNDPSQITYLDYLYCFIHCIKCKNAFHRCGKEFVVYNDYVFCLSCKEVYNEFQVHMFCKECKEEYYTKLREIKKESQTYIFPLAYEKYHCPSLGCEEKVKCNKCKCDLYIDINLDKNKGKINEIFCKNCKSIYDVKNLNNICLNCKSNFKSGIKIYNFFPSIKIDLITVIHCLFNKKYALPFIIENKPCRCDLSKSENIKHNDGGDLLEGDRLNKKVIICNRCFGVFNLDNLDWVCPKCKRGIGLKKINIFDYKDKEQNDKNDNFLAKSVILNDIKKIKEIKEIKEINNNKSPQLKKNEKNKRKININYSRYCSSNNSNKNIYNDIKKYSTNDKNNRKVCKSSKSVSYLVEKENLVKTEPKKNPYPYIQSNNQIYNRNNIKLELFNRTNNYKSNNKIKDNFISTSDRNSSPHKYQRLQRTNINIKKIDISDKTNYKNNLYKNYNKEKNNDKLYEIKKQLFYDTSLNSNREQREIKKNFSVTNDLKIRNKDNKLIFPSETNIFKKNIEDKLNQIKHHHNNHNTIKINITKTTTSINNKKIKKINQMKGTNINSIIKSNANKNSLKNLNINNIGKDINININLNHSINNIINVNNNANNKENKNYNNPNKNNIIIIDKRQNNNNSIKKLFNTNNNINKDIKNKYKNSERKNHIHIVSNITNKNNNSNQKNNSNRNKDIYIARNINNYNNNKINQSQNRIQNHLLISDNNIKKQKIESNSSKKNIESKTFNSDDYNVIDLIGEGTYGKIYLVKKLKTNEIFALKQISIKNKNDANKHKKEFEFIMKLTEENPNLNIIKILGIELKQLDKFNTVLYILIEAGKSDWEKELYRRNLKQKYYTEDELIDILASLVKTFSALQEKGISHRDVKPQNIIYFEKNKDRNKDEYKITDFGEAKINKHTKYVFMNNFEKNTNKQTVRGTELYMSPLLFNALRNTGEIDIQYNPYKSDVYSLGLCILLAASLSYIPLYQIREMKNMDKIKTSIEGYLGKLYSKKFINLLLLMLQINEKYRPDFIELNSWIYNHYFNQ